MLSELVLATSNPGKIRELQALLQNIHCIAQTTLGLSSPQETGLTFIENALIKARHASQLSNKPALADDSGLVVPALNGEPGIYSARYAGSQASDADNIAQLLTRLATHPETNPVAYFYCALVLVQHANDPIPLIATGQLVGKIHPKPQGTQGFGYDPIFFLPSHQCTLAELPLAIKNTISHRAQALQRLVDALA